MKKINYDLILFTLLIAVTFVAIVLMIIILILHDQQPTPALDMIPLNFSLC